MRRVLAPARLLYVSRIDLLLSEIVPFQTQLKPTSVCPVSLRENFTESNVVVRAILPDENMSRLARTADSASLQPVSSTQTESPPPCAMVGL